MASGAVAKKIIRGSSWQRHDFFLGVEFTLATMSSALIYLFDLIKIISESTENSESMLTKFTATAAFIALIFFLLLYVLSMHQDWQKKDNSPKGQIIRLGIIANVIGSGLLAFFILFVKGV
ncbi:MAG: hypothetical protein OMM_07132 [Candidatus Magnetoglobus multicellularis str. Araruama]|uniref:DUF202 domain-containing protein n=1 Tax=Candidatus Magnetoglobus multicellularis str. Araruama TaxID=890399 RepID=A0A1V1PEN7_9BACT|nr:MAG: hypothetical protein OMM_07132 [Candidatus Magnetoglobus multicellularis str. Araruama]